MRVLQRIGGNKFAALDGLQESVVQVPRDSGSLCQTLRIAKLHSSSHLAEAQPIHQPNEKCAQKNVEEPEPDSLIEGRLDGEVQGSSSLIPHAIVVTRLHQECISPGP